MREFDHYVDVAVIGGGLIGLSIAYHMTDFPGEICVINGDQDGKASLAGAGMLTPTCEWDTRMPDYFTNLLKEARHYYKEFIGKLCKDKNVNDLNMEYHKRDYLILDLIEKNRDLTNRFTKLQEKEFEVNWLQPYEVANIEPNINASAINGAIQVKNDSLVNPRALHSNLISRVKKLTKIIDGNIISAEKMGEGFLLTLDTNQTIYCERVVIATGAWSYEVAQLFDIDIPISPVKGQIIEFGGKTNLLNSILYMPVGACGCLLERSPGKYILGTSEEYADTEVTNTSKVIASILNRVNEVFIPARDFVITDMWSGFRPISPDELPIIDQTKDQKITIATGHHRNGILLAPLTGKIVRDLMYKKKNEYDITHYSASRVMGLHYRFGSKY
ncbi:FAD-dependent oxidoreductase [Bacillus cereus]|nr:FAD-dependent oxidoreductase [Bacillus cereus]